MKSTRSVWLGREPWRIRHSEHAPLVKQAHGPHASRRHAHDRDHRFLGDTDDELRGTIKDVASALKKV